MQFLLSDLYNSGAKIPFSLARVNCLTSYKIAAKKKTTTNQCDRMLRNFLQLSQICVNKNKIVVSDIHTWFCFF